jgi:ferredoxin-NADP reductase
MATERTGRLAAVVDRAPTTRSLLFDLADPLAFVPGQFVSCLLPIGDGGATAVRPYTIASDPEEPRRIELLLNPVPGGKGSAHLLGLAVGAALRFTGPWGTFTLARAPDADLVLVADGTGIAPIRPMLKRALAAGGTHALTLVHAAASPADYCYRDELDALAAAHPRLTIVRVASAALEDEVGRRFVDGDGDRGRHFWVCGVGAVVHRLRDRLRAAGYARRAVQYERW